jgi:hypothetical protein
MHEWSQPQGRLKGRKCLSLHMIREEFLGYLLQ